MKSICLPGNRLQGHIGDPAFDKRWNAEGRREVAELRRLNPPKADEQRLAKAFEHWKAVLDVGSRLLDAAERKDARAVDEAFRDAARDARPIARLIPDYPAGYCLGEGIG